MNHTRPIPLRLVTVIVIGVVVAFVATACGSSSSNNDNGSSGTGTTAAKMTDASVSATNGPLGTILTDSQGRTLYLFQKDKTTKSTCSGSCAMNWPPLTVHGKPKAGSGLTASQLGTTKRSDGKTQVTYNGHPLYTFMGDGNKPGATNGQGFNAFGALWYVVGTNGNAITTAASSSTSSGGGGLGY
jgi:predicted lipoprotein with Yx(FWY)xxD motif